MKKFFLSFIFVSAVIPAFAQQPALKTVDDYFYALPSSLWCPIQKDYDKETKQKLISELDIKNGWLKIGQYKEIFWEGWGEMALFKKPDKSYLVCICVFSCGPVCDNDIHFWELDGSNWKDVTKDVFKDVTLEEMKTRYAKKYGKDEWYEDMYFQYVIPRYGTSIKIITQDMTTGDKSLDLGSYTFSNGKFTLNP